MGKDDVPEGMFWADYIKTVKDRPEQRLRIARQHMPLPAAFREAAISLRALIRVRKKEGKSFDDLLEQLYRTAAQHSFLLGTPWIEGIGPGFNVAERIPRSDWESLEHPYAHIGYQNLPLLNPTDKKWLVDRWGEPSSHMTGQAYHSERWAEALGYTKAEFESRDRQFQERLQNLMEHSARASPQGLPVAGSDRRGCALRVLALLLPAAVITSVWCLLSKRDV